MSDLNVDDIILDSDLSFHRFGVIRQQQTVDAHGRVVPFNPDQPYMQFVGCVQPASGRTLEMLPELTHVSGVIEIWTRYRLEGPSDTTQADIILFGGRSYIVYTVQPWFGWGAGFVHAVCQLYNLLAKSPAKRVVDYNPP